MYSTDSFGSWSRIARATVRPPTPESKIPMGASFTGASLVAEIGGHDLHERLLHPRQGDVHRPERGSYRSYLELDRVVRPLRVVPLVVVERRVRVVPHRRAPAVPHGRAPAVPHGRARDVPHGSARDVPHGRSE